MARMKERRGASRFLMGRPGGKRTLGRTRRRGVGNIKMDLFFRFVWFDASLIPPATPAFHLNRVN